ncbi:MAG: Hsp20/alpha crystallin family protein [Desulfobacterota bacterium]|nr:Hsp20/alpha crystallin family protein [Thermodesulfobacteriota bacterium]
MAMIARWYETFDPLFEDFNRLRSELDRLFDIALPLSNIRSVPRGTFPAVNLHDGKDAVTVQVYIPGVSADKVELTVQNNTLSISGERDTQRCDDKEITPERYHRRERFSGSFTRVISLPEGIDQDKINAVCKDGILTITIAKREEQKPKQIAVKAA